MKLTAIILMLLIGVNLIAQNFMKRNGVSIGCNLIAGFSGGVGDRLIFKYDNSTFPKGGERLLWGNEQYWNPKISWKNKYQNTETLTEKFPMSSTAFVFLTDGWHLSQTIERAGMRGAMIGYTKPTGRNKGFKYVLDVAVNSFAYSIGWNMANKITDK